MMWQLKYQDAVEEGWIEGRAEGLAEGRVEGTMERALSDLKNLMRNTGWSLEQAMTTLGISESEQKVYSKLLTE